MGCLEGEQGSPGMGMELCTEALTVDLKDRRISHPEKDLLRRGKSQQRRKTPGQAGARRGASGGLPHSGRAWGSPALRPRRHCSEGGGATTVRGPRKLQPPTLLPRAPGSSQKPGLLRRSSGCCPLWSRPCGHAPGREGLRLPQPRPGLSLPAPHHPLLPTASLQSSQGHLWAHKIKYLKDAKNLSWFLWQQENNSHFPGKLKNRFFFALWVANYF